ncbi:hypothetical protein ZWY2020_036724 [Hordeum vulgare]|nr:hypothetical protein ZWY2020_036724 [Hordeum vulgare]
MALLLKRNHHLSTTSRLLLRRLCATEATTEPAPASPIPPAPDSPPPLTPVEAKLLDSPRGDPRPQPRPPVECDPSSPPFDPSRVLLHLAGLLLSPPAPHLALQLLGRLALRRGVLFPEALTFFHHVVLSLPANSLPASTPL